MLLERSGEGPVLNLNGIRVHDLLQMERLAASIGAVVADSVFSKATLERSLAQVRAFRYIAL